jgi:hypothetical protein
MTIKDILALPNTEQVIAQLKDKAVDVIAWSKLRKEYDPKEHPVNNKTLYPDIPGDKDNPAGTKVTRIALDYQRLAAARMTSLCFGLPVKRVYKAETEGQKEAQQIIEAIMLRNRIDSVNVERGNMLFAGCEVATLWYAIEEQHSLYGVESSLKVRCANYSPMKGDSIYPLFDEYGDMVALSFGYKRKSMGEWAEYFDTYTADRHIKWVASGRGKSWEAIEDESIAVGAPNGQGIGKIPAIYMHRPTPIWEDTSSIVYEIEWALSRSGNYVRANTKPLFGVFADEEIAYGGEKPTDAKSVHQFPQNAKAGYITWELSAENVKFYTNTLRNEFFTQLQIPDWTFENMKSMKMSGEAFKQLFVDAMLKVHDESGRLVEFLDREISVVKAFVKNIRPNLASDIDELQITTEVVPFTINETKTIIENLSTAVSAGIISKREAIEELGWSDNTEQTLKQIREEQTVDVMGASV